MSLTPSELPLDAAITRDRINVGGRAFRIRTDVRSCAVDPDPHPDDLAASISPLSAERIGELVREGKFCAAARLYSEATGADWIESKLAIDRLAHRHGLAPINGCASYFALIIALGGVAAWGVVELTRLAFRV